MSLKPTDIRAFTDRDWSRHQRLKDEHWLANRAARTPEERLEAGANLLLWAREVGAELPDRQEDFEHHVRLAQLLRRASGPLSR